MASLKIGWYPLTGISRVKSGRARLQLAANPTVEYLGGVVAVLKGSRIERVLGISAGRVFLNSLLVLLSVALTFSAIEVTLRLLDTPAWDTEIRAGWRALENPEHLTNELGFRGQPIRYKNGDIVVLLLGDSQVESLTCPLASMPERYLEESLRAVDPRYKVFSVGAGGYGNDQEYLALTEYFTKYRADSVILWQTMGNDIWNNVFPTNMPKDGKIKPTFWLDHGELKGPNFQLGEIVREPARTKLGVMLDTILHPQKGMDARWEHHLPPPYVPLARYDGQIFPEWDPSDPKNTNPALKYENLENEKSHFSVYLVPPSERLKYGIELTRRLFGRIKSLSRDNHSDFSILDILSPHEQWMIENWNINDQVVRRVNGKFYLTSGKQVLINKNKINDGFHNYSIPVTLKEWAVSETDPHLNCSANRQVMRDLAAQILMHFDNRSRGN